MSEEFLGLCLILTLIIVFVSVVEFIFELISLIYRGLKLLINLIKRILRAIRK